MLVYAMVFILALNVTDRQPYQLRESINKFGSIYEGLKLNGIGKFYYVFIILKKFLFMGSLILCYYEPLF